MRKLSKRHRRASSDLKSTCSEKNVDRHISAESVPGKKYIVSGWVGCGSKLFYKCGSRQFEQAAAVTRILRGCGPS